MKNFALRKVMNNQLNSDRRKVSKQLSSDKFNDNSYFNKKSSRSRVALTQKRLYKDGSKKTTVYNSNTRINIAKKKNSNLTKRNKVPVFNRKTAKNLVRSLKSSVDLKSLKKSALMKKF